MDDLIDLDVPAANAIGVWHDLERALAGKNGYGGDTAEIYAYRIVAQHLRDRADPTFITGASDAEGEAAKAELGRVAGANMTHLLRHFLDLHEDALISIEDRDGFRPLDLRRRGVPAVRLADPSSRFAGASTYPSASNSRAAGNPRRDRRGDEGAIRHDRRAGAITSQRSSTRRGTAARRGCGSTARCCNWALP